MCHGYLLRSIMAKSIKALATPSLLLIFEKLNETGLNVR